MWAGIWESEYIIKIHGWRESRHSLPSLLGQDALLQKKLCLRASLMLSLLTLEEAICLIWMAYFFSGKDASWCVVEWHWWKNSCCACTGEKHYNSVPEAQRPLRWSSIESTLSIFFDFWVFSLIFLRGNLISFLTPGVRSLGDG